MAIELLETFDKLVRETKLKVSMLQVERAYKEPRYFLENFCVVEHPIKGPVSFKLTEKQLKILEALENNVWVIDEIAERQIGATSVFVGYVLWRLLFKQDQAIMVTHMKYDHAGWFREKLMYKYDHLPEFFKMKITTNNKRDIRFENGSKLMLRNADPTAGRGNALSYLLMQDYDYYPEQVKEEMMISFTPCMSVYGKKVHLTEL